MWAFATVGFGISSNLVQLNTNNEYIYLQSDTEEEDRALVSRVLDIVADDAMNRLPRFRPQELNNLAWGICRLGCHGEKMNELFEGIGQELLKRHSYFKPQDIGTTLWSFATFEYFNEDVYKAAASELTLRKSRSFKPQELSNTVSRKRRLLIVEHLFVSPNKLIFQFQILGLGSRNSRGYPSIR